MIDQPINDRAVTDRSINGRDRPIDDRLTSEDDSPTPPRCSADPGLTNIVTRSPEMAPRLVYRNKKYGRKSCPTSLQEDSLFHRELRTSSLNYIKCDSSPEPGPPLTPPPDPLRRIFDPTPQSISRQSNSSTSDKSSNDDDVIQPDEFENAELDGGLSEEGDGGGGWRAEGVEGGVGGPTDVFSTSPPYFLSSVEGRRASSDLSPTSNLWVSDFGLRDTLHSLGPTSSLGSDSCKIVDYAVFTALDPHNTGQATVVSLVEYWECLGISNPIEVLHDLGVGSDRSPIDLKHLTLLLEEEINQSQDILRYPTVRAGVASYLSELKLVKSLLENNHRERDKLKYDLQESNQRLVVLVQEVDEQNVKLEQENNLKIQALESRWQDYVREVEKKSEEEREINNSKLKKLSGELTTTQTLGREERENHTNIISTLNKEVSRLERENSLINSRLLEQTENIQIIQQSKLQKSECDENERPVSRSDLEKEVEELTLSNTALTDQVDELQTLLQFSRKEIQRLNSSNVQVISIRGPQDSNLVSKVTVNCKTEKLENPCFKKSIQSKKPCETSRNPSEASKTNSEESSQESQNDTLDEPRRKINFKNVISDLLRRSPVQIPASSGPASLPPYTNIPSQRAGGEVQELEQHCKHLEGELDQVKFEIIRMLSERAGYSKENEVLKQYKAAFVTLKQDNLNLKRELERLQVQLSPEPGTIQPSTSSHRSSSPKASSPLAFSNAIYHNPTYEATSGNFQEAWDPQEVQWINSASLELNLQTSADLELNLPTSNPPDSLTSTESPLNLDSPSSPASHIEEDATITVTQEAETKSEPDCAAGAGTPEVPTESRVGGADSPDCSPQEMHRSSPDGQEFVCHPLGKENLQEKITQLKQEKEQENSKWKGTLQSYEEKIRELENSIELIRSEFESMEDYWQTKLEDERGFYEHQLRQNEQQFTQLETRMKEYDTMFGGGGGGGDKEQDRLSTIEESSSMEQQVTQWEQEIASLTIQLDQMEQVNSAQLESQEDEWNKRLGDLNLQWNQKVDDLQEELSRYKNQQQQSQQQSQQQHQQQQQQHQQSREINDKIDSLDVWKVHERDFKSGGRSTFIPHVPISPRQGPSSLPVDLVNTAQREVRRLQELRRIIQEECDNLLLKKERLREEVCQSLWFNNPWMVAGEQTSGLDQQVSGFGQQTSGLDLQTSGLGEKTTGFGLKGFGLGTMDCTATDGANFKTWSLDMLDGITDVEQLVGGGGGFNPLAECPRGTRACKSDNHIYRKDNPTHESMKEKAFVAPIASSYGGGVMVDGGVLAEGRNDAWTQIPHCTEAEIHEDNVHAIATAYKIVHLDIEREKRLLEHELCRQASNPMDNNPSPGLVEANITCLKKRLDDQTERCRQLQTAMTRQQHQNQTILQCCRDQHRSEVDQLEGLVSVGKELVTKQTNKYTKQVEKLSLADQVIAQLLSENDTLMTALLVLQNESAIGRPQQFPAPFRYQSEEI